MKFYSKILISIALLVSSCAPNVMDRQFEDPNTSFKSGAKDVHLNLRLREFGELPPKLSWQGTVSSAVYFDQAENLIRLGEETGRPGLRQKGLFWIRYFYQVPEATSMMDMAYSPFIKLAAAQTEKEVQSILNDVLLQMEDARPVIIGHVLALGAKRSVNPKTGLEGLLSQAEEFNRSLLADIPNMNLPPVIENGFRTELVKTTEPLFAEVRGLLESFKTLKTLSETLDLIDVAIKKFEVILDPGIAKTMAQGRKLGRGLDHLQDAQGALTVIVDVWSMLTSQERVDKIRSANEELYNFLLKQDAKELECLRTRGCLGGPIDGVVKKLFILPKIEKYGVSGLKETLNQQSVDYAIASLESFAQEFVKTMPQNFVEHIEAAWFAKMTGIAGVVADFQSYVTRVGGVWSKKILPGTAGKIPGVEASFLEISASAKSELSLKAIAKPSELNGEVAGSSLSANVFLMQNAPAKDELGLRAALSQINKIVALSGFRNTRDQLVPALLAPVDHSSKLLDIVNFEESKNVNHSFRLPDAILLQDPFLAAPEMNYERNFSASALSAQIKGLSQTLRFTADWKSSSFDLFLSPIKAQDLTQDAEDPALQQPLFPKEMLFTLNLGTVSVLLRDLIKKITPVFLLTLDNKILWADQYPAKGNETAVMAGIVDIKNGKRANLVETREVAKFILALSEFIEALDGVEGTRSPILLTRNAKGIRPLESLTTGKKDLKLLIIALSNFLSKKMKTENSLVHSSYILDQRKFLHNKPISVDTQAYAIRSLVKAYEISGIEAYLLSAEEIYYAMNRNLYSLKREFYVNSDGTVLRFPEIVNTLRALSAIKSHIPVESQKQLQKIIDPWLDSLSVLK
jgi:hypothetical protein